MLAYTTQRDLLKHVPVLEGPALPTATHQPSRQQWSTPDPLRAKLLDRLRRSPRNMQHLPRALRRGPHPTPLHRTRRMLARLRRSVPVRVDRDCYAEREQMPGLSSCALEGGVSAG